MVLLLPDLKQNVRFTHSYLHSNMVLLLPTTVIQLENLVLNLHSNMVLLLHHFRMYGYNVNRIYIPIWCYFYENFDAVTKHQNDNLHSNMVLLLLSIVTCQRKLFQIFTFQYGATSTSCYRYINFTPTIFTFQYGATSTYLRLKDDFFDRDLHSNMVLLLRYYL